MVAAQKRKYRIIDFKEIKTVYRAKLPPIEYDPNRTAKHRFNPIM